MGCLESGQNMSDKSGGGDEGTQEVSGNKGHR